MTDNHTKRQNAKKRNKAEFDLLSTKFSFAAGVVLVATMTQNIVECFFELPSWTYVAFAIFGIAMFLIILESRTFNEMIKKHEKNAAHCGEFLTIMTIVFFILDNSFAEIYASDPSSEVSFDLVCYVAMWLVTIIAACVILFGVDFSKKHK